MRLGFRLLSWERSPSASQPCWDLEIRVCRDQPGARCWGNAASHRAAASPACALPVPGLLGGLGGLGGTPHSHCGVMCDPAASCHPPVCRSGVESSPRWGRMVSDGLGDAGARSPHPCQVRQGLAEHVQLSLDPEGWNRVGSAQCEPGLYTAPHWGIFVGVESGESVRIDSTEAGIS